MNEPDENDCFFFKVVDVFFRKFPFRARESDILVSRAKKPENTVLVKRKIYIGVIKLCVSKATFSLPDERSTTFNEFHYDSGIRYYGSVE